MYNFIIVSDSNKHFDIPIKEYLKRLGKKVKILYIKPIKNKSDSIIIIKETDLIIKSLKKIRGFKIILKPNSKDFTTQDFLKFINNKKQLYSDIVFIVGGAFGVDYGKLKDFVDFELSLGNFVMPHSLAFLVILEQIYRIEMINKGTSYHK